ncbi:hypothetical protein T069G_09135 [Trichoderma breve]|uniref:Nucleoside phosphorylase domain-containing protein n=1 Tax=Trichoderma breve TaxID=2034170 RepID=A0A9W9B4S7_9HYPO|nr:hypothetical protein T069G_09135 [Trichoderma breve]KAJ4855767.1 hypothetical protein T069G_09135 [Trichoderma breve]
MAEELTYGSYTVGWICVLPSELCAARALLDEEHEPLPPMEIDDNNYFLGKMANHNVVIVFPGSYGIRATAQAARTFPNIRFALMVGVGIGLPKLPNSDPRKDIRLGDVVVGAAPVNGVGGVMKNDVVRVAGEPPNLRVRGCRYNPPQLLLKATRRLQLDHDFGKGKMWTDIDQVVSLGVPALEDAGYPGVERDQLFKLDYKHSAGEDCSSCDVTQIEERRPYAAIAAAAYAKDLLRVIHPKEVAITPLPKNTEPLRASQVTGDTQAMGNGAGAVSSLGANRLQIKNENTQADVKILRAESI